MHEKGCITVEGRPGGDAVWAVEGLIRQSKNLVDYWHEHDRKESA